jgi:hypothetical protein
VKLNAGGVQREAVVKALEEFGLTLTQKSSSHYHAPGQPQGVRVVVPPRNPVVKLFVYQLPEAKDLPGYRTPEQRKAERLAAVTHVVDVTGPAQVEAVAFAVANAAGLLKQDGHK